MEPRFPGRLVQIDADETVHVDVPVEIGGTVRGRVVDAAGAPIADASIVAKCEPSISGEGFNYSLRRERRCHPEVVSLHPLLESSTRTTADGSFALGGLPSGPLVVEVSADGFTCERLDSLVLAAGEPRLLDTRLEAAGALQVAAPMSVLTLGVRRRGETSVRCRLDLNNAFACTFPGLAPGDYEIIFIDGDGERVLAHAAVVAGRTTWLDARDAPLSDYIRGRVVDSDGPVAGAYVEIARNDGIKQDRMRTGSDGRFVIPRGTKSDSPRTEIVVWTGPLGTHFHRDAPEARVDLGDLVLGGERLDVQVFDPSGKSTQAIIGLDSYSEPKNEDWSEHQMVQTDELGRFTFTRLERGTYSVKTQIADRWIGGQETKLPHSGIFSVQLRDWEVDPPHLVVHVRNEDGTPVGGLVVHASTMRDLTDSAHSFIYSAAEETTSADGDARIKLSRSGAMTLEILRWEKRDLNPWPFVAPRRQIEIPDHGTIEVTIVGHRDLSPHK
jgi:hypothetical protein